MNKKFKYVYIIFYSHEKGCGNMELYRNRKIKTYEDIKSIQKLIENDYNLKQVVITNYKRISRRKQ